MGDVDLTLSSLGQQEFKEMKPDTQEISGPNVCSLQLDVCCFFPFALVRVFALVYM